MSDVPAWDESTERELLLRCQAGERSAYEPIVRHYMRRAYFMALGLVGDSQHAEDLSQDAFARVFRNIGSYNVDLPFYPWFYRILKNLCLNHLRGRKRRAELSLCTLEESGFETRSSSNNPEEDYADSQMKRAMWQAIFKLNEADREIIILKHFEDLSYAEIAQTLDIPNGTVMSRLYNARQRLRGLMQDYIMPQPCGEK